MARESKGEKDEEGTQGRGVELEALGRAARALTAARFADQHGEAFLLLADVHLEGPGGPGATVLGIPSTRAGDDAGVWGNPRLVHPIRRSGRSVGHLVSAGRTSNNDVVIPDSSVSRFHAFFKQTSDGRFQVQDAGSTNGTAVNHDPVPAQGEGSPVALKSGDTVTIGRVSLRFYEAEPLHELLGRSGQL